MRIIERAPLRPADGAPRRRFLSRACIVANVVLLAWFALDMVGVSFGDATLVTAALADDGPFFLLALILFAWALLHWRTGRWALALWLGVWLTAQVMIHEAHIFQPGSEAAERLSTFFADTIHLVQIPGWYVPDVYHLILHLLIAVALAHTIISIIRSLKNARRAKEQGIAR